MSAYDYFIGIDPGATGAITVLNPDGTSVIYVNPLNATKSDVDGKEVYRIITQTMSKGRTFVAIERSQSMPGQGVAGVFTYGRGYGKLLAALEIAGVAFEEVTSVKWKKVVGLSIPKIQKEKMNERKKRLKAASAALAVKLFPDDAGRIFGPMGGIKDGIAESLLLAEYGRRIYK